MTQNEVAFYRGIGLRKEKLASALLTSSKKHHPGWATKRSVVFSATVVRNGVDHRSNYTHGILKRC